MPPPPGRARGGPIRGRGSSQPALASFADTRSHIISIGVRRPNFGISGKAVTVSVNAFPTTVPEAIIYHYDGNIFLDHD
jgi:eukaryotic translation initiation factor 2C